jgi:hypothetical protein
MGPAFESESSRASRRYPWLVLLFVLTTESEEPLNSKSEQYRFARIEGYCITLMRLEEQFRDRAVNVEKMEAAVNYSVTAKVLICNGSVPKDRNMVWTLPLNRIQPVDVTIIGRLKAPERNVLDYFIIPAISQLRGTFQTRERENDPFLEIYRFDDLDAFVSSFRQCSIAEMS